MILQSIKWHRAHSQWDERKSCVQSEGHSSQEEELDPQHGSSIKPLSPSPNLEMLVVELTRQVCKKSGGVSAMMKATQKSGTFAHAPPSAAFENLHPNSPRRLVFPEGSFWHSTRSDESGSKNRAGISLLKMWKGNWSFPALLSLATYLS